MADALHDFFGTTTAPDCSVECVGVHYTKSWRHKLELLAGARLRTDNTVLDGHPARQGSSSALQLSNAGKKTRQV